MSASVVQLFSTDAALPGNRFAIPRDWSSQELAEMYRVSDLLGQSGLPVETEAGLSDEGDPWFIFCRADTSDVIAHFARIDGQFIAASVSIDVTLKGHSLRDIIDQLVARQPLLVPRPAGRDNKLFLHPIVVLTAFVATALIQSQDADAANLGSRPELFLADPERLNEAALDAARKDTAHSGENNGDDAQPQPLSSSSNHRGTVQAQSTSEARASGAAGTGSPTTSATENSSNTAQHTAILAAVALAISSVETQANTLSNDCDVQTTHITLEATLTGSEVIVNAPELQAAPIHINAAEAIAAFDAAPDAESANNSDAIISLSSHDGIKFLVTAQLPDTSNINPPSVISATETSAVLAEAHSSEDHNTVTPIQTVHAANHDGDASSSDVDITEDANAPSLDEVASDDAILFDATLVAEISARLGPVAAAETDNELVHWFLGLHSEITEVASLTASGQLSESEEASSNSAAAVIIEIPETSSQALPPLPEGCVHSAGELVDMIAAFAQDDSSSFFGTDDALFLNIFAERTKGIRELVENSNIEHIVIFESEGNAADIVTFRDSMLLVDNSVFGNYRDFATTAEAPIELSLQGSSISLTLLGSVELV